MAKMISLLVAIAIWFLVKISFFDEGLKLPSKKEVINEVPAEQL